MLKILTVSLITLFLTSSLCSQDTLAVINVHNILKSKDFIALQAKNDSGNVRWESLRDLTEDFQEGVLIFGYSVQDRPGVYTDYTFKADIIATKSKIIYYELSKRFYSNKSSFWDYEKREAFKDDSAYKTFENSFRSLFHADLDPKDLFNTSFPYGTNCGMGSGSRLGAHEIELFDEERHKALLFKWLTSANTEKQLLAIDGLHSLRLQGLRLTEDQLRIIKFVLNKKGNVYLCGGCVFFRWDISNSTRHLSSFKDSLDGLAAIP